MATTLWEVTAGVATYTGYGDTAEDVAKALLKKARSYTGKQGASSIDLCVWFSGEAGDFIGTMTVCE